MPIETSPPWEERGRLAARLRGFDADEMAEISRRAARRVNGVFASLKNDRGVRWRREDERDLLRLLEVDPEVVAYWEMPEVVELSLDGRTHRHVPAARAATTRGEVVFDVAGASPAARALSDALADIYAVRNTAYAALTPAQVRVEPRFRNARHVLRHAGVPLDDRGRIRVLEALSRRRGAAMTVAELRAVLGPEAEAVFPMAIRRLVRLDLSAPDPSGIRAYLDRRASSE